MSIIEDCQGNKKVVKAIEAAIRKVFRFSIHYVDVKDSALVKETGPRGGRRYKCAVCENVFPQNSVQVDHKEPVVPLDSKLEDLSLSELYSRISCPAENLQVICVSCHKDKTKKEASERARRRRLKKEIMNEESTK